MPITGIAAWALRGVYKAPRSVSAAAVLVSVAHKPDVGDGAPLWLVGELIAVVLRPATRKGAMPGYRDKRRARLASLCALTLSALLTGCVSSGGALGSRDRGSSRRGALWTIRCLELPGTEGSNTVEQVAASLRRTPGIHPNKVFIRDSADGYARLYYGRYHRRLDAATGRRTESAQLRRDLDLLHELGVGGRRLFLGAIPVRMPRPDVGNPAWDLRRSTAVYSLQVAVFEPTEDFFEFKQAAADYCKLLRDRGYEAYYYHAPASSSVTVGSFGPEAVVVGADGKTRYSATVQRLQHEDELLRYNLLNGSIYRVRNETGLSERVPSRLVEVPPRG